MQVKFKTIIAETDAGTQMQWGDGGFPISDTATAALLATIPPPPPAKMQVIEAVKDAPNRGHGIEVGKVKPVQGEITVRDAFVRNYAQNVVAEGIDPLIRITLENIRSSDSWRDNPGDKYQGQPFYFQNCGPVSMRGCAGFNGGWQPGRPANRRSMFLHGAYQNVGCGYLDIEWSAFGSNPNAGVEFKGKGEISDSLLFDNGTGLLALKGPLAVRRCVILDGHRYASGLDNGQPPMPVSWTGNTAIQTYCPTDGEDILAVGGPNQLAPDLTPAKAVNMGAINGSKTYPGQLEDGTTPAGSSWNLKRVYAWNWKGPVVSGDAAPDESIVRPYQPASIPSTAEIIHRLSDRNVPVKDTVMWVFQQLKVPWLSIYK